MTVKFYLPAHLAVNIDINYLHNIELSLNREIVNKTNKNFDRNMSAFLQSKYSKKIFADTCTFLNLSA